MIHAIGSRPASCVISVALALALSTSLYAGQPADGEEDGGPSAATRLRFMQQLLKDMQIESLDDDDSRDLKFQLKPLLRYNDVTRRIADSALWRLGTSGRPVAIVTSELYGRDGRRFLLNHEFLALDDPRLRLQRDSFVWQPAEGALKFQPIENQSPPADNPRLRLAQFRRLAEKFSAEEQLGKSKIVLRHAPAPIDRYMPSDHPKADGAVFAFVWGVNPEALLFLETDGAEWSFAWARLGAARVKAELDGDVVWEQPAANQHEHPTATYTSIHRSATIPLDFEQSGSDAD